MERLLEAGLLAERRVGQARLVRPDASSSLAAVTGTPDPMAVYDACRRVGDQVRRDVNPSIMTPNELTAPSSFLTQVRSGAMVAVIGKLPWQCAR